MVPWSAECSWRCPIPSCGLGLKGAATAEGKNIRLAKSIGRPPGGAQGEVLHGRQLRPSDILLLASKVGFGHATWRARSARQGDSRLQLNTTKPETPKAQDPKP